MYCKVTQAKHRKKKLKRFGWPVKIGELGVYINVFGEEKYELCIQEFLFLNQYYVTSKLSEKCGAINQ